MDLPVYEDVVSKGLWRIHTRNMRWVLKVSVIAYYGEM